MGQSRLDYREPPAGALAALRQGVIRAYPGRAPREPGR